MSRVGVFLSSQFRLVALTAMSVALMAVTCETASAQQGWGGSQGGYASSGGSMGCCGGNVARRTPVRNLLGRICGHFANHRAKRIARRDARFGSSGGSSGGMSYGGCCGGWVGCSGGYMTSGVYSGWGSPMVQSNVVTLNPGPSAYGYFDPSCCGVYPGIVNGSPVPVQGLPGENSVLDGGSIDSMLDGNQPSGGQDYYDKSGTPDAGNGAVPTPAPEGGAIDSTSTGSMHSRASVLSLVLPSAAKVFINGKLTQTEGIRRSYVSRNLTENRDYNYEVKAIVVRNGKNVVRTQLVKMRPGLNKTVKFDFSEPSMTTLALNVPVGAKVTLCGNPTLATGTTRSFSTDALKNGQVWKDYKVRVDFERDGEIKTEERSFDMVAGETYQLTIGAEAAPVADRIASR